MSKAKQPVAYTASVAVYVDGVVYKAGETFVTDKPKGETWDEVNPVEKAAADAGKPVKDDIDLNAMSASELKAYAASLGVNVGEASSKADLMAVIAAHDDPTK